MKVFKIIVACLFAFNTAVGNYVSAQPADSVISKFNFDDFEIPYSAGDVKAKFKGKSDKTVIHIQDAHCNYACQHKISDIIDYLSEDYGIDTLNLEGGAGNYDLSMFTRIDDLEIRKEVTDYFVKEGLVSGAEYFAINSPTQVTLKGIEEPELYYKNLNAYRDMMPYEKEIKDLLKNLSNYLNKTKSSVYSPELNALDTVASKYKKGDVEFKDYLLSLTDTAKNSNIDISNHTSIVALKELLEIEKSIDFRKAQRERTSLIDKLTDTLSPAEQARLVKKTAEYKEGNISNENFYKYVFNKAKFANLNEKDFPELAKYISYLKSYESIDKQGVYKEMSELEKDLFNKLFQNQEQKELYEVDKKLDVISDMFNINLTKEKYSEYVINKSGYKVKNLHDFFQENGILNKLSKQDKENFFKLDEYREKIEMFYKYSFDRDVAFIESMKESLEDRDVAVLVTGGFHKDNLQQLIKDEGISYIEIMPKFTNDNSVRNNYKNLLRGDKTELNIFIDKCYSELVSASNIAIPSPFSEMGIDIKAQNMMSLQSQVLAHFTSYILAGESVAPFVIFDPTRGYIVFNSGEDFLEGRTSGFRLTGAMPMTASIFTLEAFNETGLEVNATQTLVLVDGDTMTLEQQEEWIDRMGDEKKGGVGTDTLSSERKIKLINGLQRLGLTDYQISLIFARENILVWKSPIGVEAHPGGEHIGEDGKLVREIYLSPLVFARRDIDAAGVLLHELGAAYGTPDSANRELNKAIAAMPQAYTKPGANRTVYEAQIIAQGIVENIFQKDNVVLRQKTWSKVWDFLKSLFYLEGNRFAYQAMRENSAIEKYGVLKGLTRIDPMNVMSHRVSYLWSKKEAWNQDDITITAEEEKELALFQTLPITAIEQKLQALRAELQQVGEDNDTPQWTEEYKEAVTIRDQIEAWEKALKKIKIAYEEVGKTQERTWSKLWNMLKPNILLTGNQLAYEAMRENSAVEKHGVLKGLTKIDPMNMVNHRVSYLWSKKEAWNQDDITITQEEEQELALFQFDPITAIETRIFILNEQLQSIGAENDTPQWTEEYKEAVTIREQIEAWENALNKVQRYFTRNTARKKAGEDRDFMVTDEDEGQESTDDADETIEELAAEVKERLGIPYTVSLESSSGISDASNAHRLRHAKGLAVGMLQLLRLDGLKGKAGRVAMKIATWLIRKQLDALSTEDQDVRKEVIAWWSGFYKEMTVDSQESADDVDETIEELATEVKERLGIPYTVSLESSSGISDASNARRLRYAKGLAVGMLQLLRLDGLKEKAGRVAMRIATWLIRKQLDALSTENEDVRKEVIAWWSGFYGDLTEDPEVAEDGPGRVSWSSGYNVDDIRTTASGQEAGDETEEGMTETDLYDGYWGRFIQTHERAITLLTNHGYTLNRRRVSETEIEVTVSVPAELTKKAVSVVVVLRESDNIFKTLDSSLRAFGAEVEFQGQYGQSMPAFENTLRELAYSIASSARKTDTRLVTFVMVEKDNGYSLPSAPSLEQEKTGKKFITEQFSKVLKQSKNFMFRGMHADEPVYDFITANDVVTGDDGENVLGAYQKISLVRSAAQDFVEDNNVSDKLRLDYNVGLEMAKKSILKIKQISEAQGVTAERIHYSLAGSLLDILEKDATFKKELGLTKEQSIRDWLGGNPEKKISGIAMLDVIKDTENGKIYMMPFGRVGVLGLAKLNLSFVASKPNVTSGEISEAIKPVAYAMGLVSNNLDRINEIEQFLQKQAEISTVFYKRVFEVALPPIAKINYEVIKQGFEAEAEVLRSL